MWYLLRCVSAWIIHRSSPKEYLRGVVFYPSISSVTGHKALISAAFPTAKYIEAGSIGLLYLLFDKGKFVIKKVSFLRCPLRHDSFSRHASPKHSLNN